MKRLGFALIGLLALTACNKEPGVGGAAVIKGNVWVENWNGSYTMINAEYAGADKDVYINYGTGNTVDDRVKTGPDGSFYFAYLLPGTYTIWVYSEDPEKQAQAPNNVMAVKMEVEITDKKEVVDVGQVTVID